jgi:hypothetical protein
MRDEQYSKREMDNYLKTTSDQLDRIEVQVRYTNGRVSKLERNLLIVAVVLATTVVIKFPELIETIRIFL